MAIPNEILNINNYHAIVYTYKTVGISKLYEHYIADEELKLLKEDGVELCVIQTCNRVEAYLYSTQEELERFLKRLDNAHKKPISNEAIILHGRDAIKHLFEVSSGIDSLAIGEYEILGQIRDSLGKCKKLNLSGQALDFLFNEALKVGREVRLKTQISRGKTGVYALAIDYAVKRFGSLKGVKIAIVGAGEIGSKLALMLKNEGADDVTIFNRTYEKALNLANKYGFKAKVLNFDEVNEYDLVFVAIYYDKKVKLEKPKLVIDLSVPQIVEGNNTITLEDLKALSNLVVEKKREEINKVNDLILSSLEKFEKDVESFNVNRIISRVMSRVERILEEEIDEAYKELTKQSTDEDYIKEVLHKMGNSLIKKIFSPLFNEIRRNRNNYEYLDYIVKVFGDGELSDLKAKETKE